MVFAASLAINDDRGATSAGDRGVQPAKALDQTPLEIEARYGMPTADFVAMQLEYPRHRAAH